MLLIQIGHIVIKYFHDSQIASETSEISDSNTEEILEVSPATHPTVSTSPQLFNDAFYEDMLRCEPAMVNIKNNLFNDGTLCEIK